MIKVRNITNANGNKVPNQFEIVDVNNATFFQSYDSVVAMVKDSSGKVYLDEYYWDYSVTTMKHLYNFLRQWGYDLNKKKVLQLIEDDVFALTNLNKV
tara:strand:- start:43 stop:336 length:294 start_codon:yes stop_codon:yes gene_type:complete